LSGHHAASLLLACALAASGGAAGQVLYKWVDAQGRVQYSDKPPKDFKGEVTRIQPEDYPPAVVRPVPQPAAKGQDGKADLNTQRRVVRERLAADIARARDKRDAAKRALDEAQPTDDERQVIQQRVSRGGNTKPQPIANRDATQARTTGGGMHGMSADRTNCREVVSNGRKGVVCPTSIPGGEAFRERVKALEEALAAAEEELAAAESAYRRGVD
jgi:hypothetical protein